MDAGPYWSEIWAGGQWLYLPHNNEVVQFGWTGWISACDAAQAELWHFQKSIQLPPDIFAPRMSPDGQVLAALKLPQLLEEDQQTEEGVRHIIPSLIHICLEGDTSTQHVVVQQFKQGWFRPEWIPCQRLAQHRAYFVADFWDRVYLCDCHQHCVVRIIDCRPWPLYPDSFRFHEDCYMFFTQDGRAAVMRGHDRPDFHILSWRSLPSPP